MNESRSQPIIVSLRTSYVAGEGINEGSVTVDQVHQGNPEDPGFQEFWREVHAQHSMQSGLLDRVEYDMGIPMLLWLANRAGVVAHEMQFVVVEVEDPSLPTGAEVEYYLTCTEQCPCFERLDEHIRIRAAAFSGKEKDEFVEMLHIAGPQALERLPKAKEILESTGNPIDASGLVWTALREKDLVTMPSHMLIANTANLTASQKITAKMIKEMQAKIESLDSLGMRGSTT